MYCDNAMRPIVCIVLALLLTGCGGGGGGGGGSSATASTQGNVLSVTVDSGLVGNAVNSLYATVTVCQPGSTGHCQTIDHILVDTGSTGLRLMSGVMAPGLNLSRTNAASGFPLLNCAQFLDNSFAWGPVVNADVVLGGKTAASVPIQVIADPAFNHLASACSSGTALTTSTGLGANGILGMGLFKEDCGPGCATNALNGFYYTCTTVSCSASAAATASTSQQLKNPVAQFATDNNGLLIDLPAVAAGGATSVSGSIVFGIGTRSNNQFTSGTVLATSSGDITTDFASQSLSNSIIDTGSNGLFFDSATIPACGAGAPGFYCPATLQNFSATQRGTNAVSTAVSFSIDNALALFAAPTRAALPTLSGPIGSALIFDWGLPFFYGRRVFFGVEQQMSPLGSGPFYAF